MAATSSKSFNEQEYVLTEHGTKLYTMCGMRFEVTEEYQVRKAVGQGAYGLVCAGRRRLPNGTYQPVAIKKIPKAFEDTTDCKRLLREIKIQLHFSHLNVLGVLDILPPVEGKDGWKDVYLVCDLMDTDLHYIIHSKQPLEDQHFRYFLYQIMRGVHALHAAHVLHRDLKPGNLLVNKNCDLKICDFGLARPVNPDPSTKEDRCMTEYVVTRWYRAPELLVENQDYTGAIDIWACGCILAEMIAREALFKGRDYLHQLRLIIDVLGTPSEEDLKWIANDKAYEFVKTLPIKRGRAWSEVFPNAHPDALDLLGRMLVWNPAKRCTMAEALTSSYLTKLHAGKLEAPEPFSFGFDKPGKKRSELRELVWREMCRFRPECAKASTPDAGRPPPIRRGWTAEEVDPAGAKEATRKEAASPLQPLAEANQASPSQPKQADPVGGVVQKLKGLKAR
jgi:mitogen-activated protein kinase 1/3